jgi:hypothetical protein
MSHVYNWVHFGTRASLVISVRSSIDVKESFILPIPKSWKGKASGVVSWSYALR